MIQLLVKRLVSTIPTLFLLLTLVFFLIRLAPGGPFDSEQVWPIEIQQAIESKYGLDQPVWRQYLHYLKSVLSGDLNESFQYIGRPISEMISESAPVSLFLGLAGLGMSMLMGIPLGLLAGWKRHSLWDRFAMVFAVTGVSLPSYLTASLLILVFSLQFRWFPPALWEDPTSWVLPAITLAVRPASSLARLTRSAVADALSSDYIRTALAKGLKPRSVLLRHALANSWIPLIAVLGPTAANLVTGSFLVETVFQIPGVGKYFVQGVLNRDYPLVMGISLFYGVILLTSNFLADIATSLADPRIRFDSQTGRGDK